jgi:hypothetical protein
MPDPIWVDTNILIRILRGDKVLEAELVKIRDLEGHKLLIAPKTWDELRNGNVLTMDPQAPQIPSQADRNKVEGLRQRLKIEVDMEGKKVGSYQKRYIDPTDSHREPQHRRRIDVGQQHRIDDHLRVLDNVSESDSLVLSEVKAGAVVRGIKKPVIFTSDGGVTANAQRLDIRARNPTPKNPPVPPVPTIPVARVVNMGRSAKLASAWKATAIGVAIAGAIGGALIAFAAYLLQEQQNKENQKRIAEGFRKLQKEIERYVVARTRLVLDEAASPDGKVYVVAKVEIHSSHVNNPGFGPTTGMIPPSPEAVESVKLDSIYISSKKKEGAAEEKHPFGVFVQETYSYQYVSSEVTPPKELITDYNTLRQYREYSSAIVNHPTLTAADQAEIKQVMRKLDEQMAQLGTMDQFSPDPNLWTDDGLKRMTGS